MMKFPKSFTLLAASALAGCSHLPVDGPDYRDIDSWATVHLATSRHAMAYEYALVDVTAGVLDTLSHIGSESLHRSFGARGSAPPALRVGVGDILQVSVFESATGGLFLPSDGGARSANFVAIPNQMIGRSGTVTIPYAGQIRALGRTIPEIERDIERKLAGRAIEPQVVVSVIEQNSSTVSLLGDTLNGANKFKLAGNGERVLDLISRAGGTRFPGYELYVSLQRNNRRATVHFPRLIQDPRENIFVAPGDTLYVYREPQKYVALGALGSAGQTSGLTGQYAFDQERLSLNEALAKAGGLQDSRANPSQVFLYRMEYREALEKMGVNLAGFSPDLKVIPTVYRANFRDPSSFFAAQKFQMRNKDVIYAANSDATEVVKFLGYARAVTSTVSGVVTDVAVTRDVFDGRRILSTD
jgi:polysaccharide export outer membrane protein